MALTNTSHGAGGRRCRPCHRYSLRRLLLVHPPHPPCSWLGEHPIASSINFSPLPGYHNGSTGVVLSANIPFDDFEIRYTTNGSPPTRDRTIYTGPISVTRDTVIRAAGFLDGREVVRSSAGTYFVRRPQPNLPVMSVSMNPADFSNVHNNSGGRGRGSEREAYLEIFNDSGEQAIQTGF